MERVEVIIADTNQKEVVDRLVGQYARLFGPASQEVCRDAVASIVAELSPSDIPTSVAP
jgi:hypothetical protein